MDAPLDELYLNWLYSQVASVRSRIPSKTYWTLIRKLYTIEFVWLIPNDDNRVEDGRELRYEFIEDRDLDVEDPEWLGLGCSMLEMLIALSRRVAFEAEGRPQDWFWHMIENLDLAHHTDAHCNGGHSHCEEHIEETCNNVIYRTYAQNGVGGLFPLNNPEQDQREVELWYQLCAYILERESF